MKGQKSHSSLWVIFFAVTVTLGIGGNLSRQAMAETKTQRGLNFAVPEDWPVEESGGIVAPVPVQDYVLKKFAEIKTELEALRQDIGGANPQTAFTSTSTTIQSYAPEVTERLDALEAEVQALKAGAEVWKTFEARFEKIDAEQKSLQTQMDDWKTWQEDVERRLGHIEFKLDI